MEIKLNSGKYTAGYVHPSKTMLPKLQAALANIPNIQNLEVHINGAQAEGRAWRTLRVYEPGPLIGNGAEHKFYFSSGSLENLTPTKAWLQIVQAIQAQFPG